MILERPKYYDAFSCIAAACPDSCCQEWEVEVDPESAARYRGLSGPLGDRLRQVLYEEEGTSYLAIQDRRCPMWRADGLCRIQAELGEAALCHTCRTFPRLRHDYGSLVQLQLELSCPEAARLILTSPAQLLMHEAQPGGECPEYDMEVMVLLRRSRDAALELLANEAWSMPQALAGMLIYAHCVQNELDGGEAACVPEQIPHITKQGDMAAIFSLFQTLEILTPQWRDRLAHGGGITAWNSRHRALARYFVLRYWLQSVSDFDLVGRAKLAVTACLLVNALGGNTIETAQQFSKEIENDPDNMETLLCAAYTSPALSDENLLALLQRD